MAKASATGVADWAQPYTLCAARRSSNTCGSGRDSELSGPARPQHDAQDPVGFHVRTADGGVGVLTDLGQATRLVLERVRGVSALFIEANYDLNLLQDDTRRPWAIKQRIMSRHGHLANTAAAEAVETLANGTLRNIVLGHLSRDCNTPEIARAVVASRLGQAGIDNLRINVSTQAETTKTITL